MTLRRNAGFQPPRPPPRLRPPAACSQVTFRQPIAPIARQVMARKVGGAGKTHESIHPDGADQYDCRDVAPQARAEIRSAQSLNSPTHAAPERSLPGSHLRERQFRALAQDRFRRCRGASGLVSQHKARQQMKGRVAPLGRSHKQSDRRLPRLGMNRQQGRSAEELMQSV